VLPLLLVFVFLVALLGVAIGTAAVLQTTQSGQQIFSEQARAAADAGVREAMLRLERDRTYDTQLLVPAYFEIALPASCAAVEISGFDVSNAKTITADGRARNTVRRLEATVRIPEEGNVIVDEWKERSTASSIGTCTPGEALVGNDGAPVNELRQAADNSLSYRQASGVTCPNATSWVSTTNYGTGTSDYIGEVGFNLSDLAGKTVSNAKVCAYLQGSFGDATYTNYIVETSSLTCASISASAVPPHINASDGSEVLNNVLGWKCITIDPAQVNVGNMWYVQWWGNDVATATYRFFSGYAALSNCGNSNPSGATDCRPYLDITYQ